MIRITDKSFRYTPSYETDLRKKFRKIEQEQRASKARAAITEASMDRQVVTIASRRTASLPQ